MGVSDVSWELTPPVDTKATCPLCYNEVRRGVAAMVGESATISTFVHAECAEARDDVVVVDTRADPIEVSVAYK